MKLNTIASVLAQTNPNFELLVWDDGAIARSVEIARNYAKRDRRIPVVCAEHQGTAAALKAATTNTTGTYLGWGDSDDLLAPTALAATAKILDQYPKVQHLRKPLYYYRHHQSNISRQKRIEQIHDCQKAIALALKRRGLSARFTIEVRNQNQFCLCRKS